MRALVGAAVILGLVGSAEAQDKAGADTLFDEGRQLMAAGKAAEACAKFEASVSILPQLGVRLNLGDCYEKIGRTASAWSSFRAAESMANRAGDQARWSYATQRIRALEPKLSRLVVKVDVAGIEVRRDGGLVPAAMYGTAVPVDPGSRELVATAEGYEEWRHTVLIPSSPGTVEVLVPPLKKVKVTLLPKARAVDAGPANQGKTRRILGLTVGGAGLATIGVAAVFGIGAKSAWSDAKAMGCSEDGVCPTQAALDRLESGRSKALLSTILGVGGVALVGTGVVLYLTAPKRREGMAVTPAIAPGFVGLSLGGGF